MNDNSNTGCSIGFTGLLALLFITLKLTGYIDWSWVWVTAPLWIPPVFILAVLCCLGVVALVTLLITTWLER